MSHLKKDNFLELEKKQIIQTQKKVTLTSLGKIASRFSDRIYSRIIGRINGRIYSRIIGRINGRIYRRIIGRINGRINDRIIGRINGRIYSRIRDRQQLPATDEANLLFLRKIKAKRC